MNIDTLLKKFGFDNLLNDFETQEDRKTQFIEVDFFEQIDQNSQEKILKELITTK